MLYTEWNTVRQAFISYNLDNYSLQVMKIKNSKPEKMNITYKLFNKEFQHIPIIYWVYYSHVIKSIHSHGDDCGLDRCAEDKYWNLPQGG